MGTKALVMAPSAKSLRSRFGILKAMKKASETALDPRKRAKSMVLTSPRIRLPAVASAINIPLLKTDFISYYTSNIKSKKNLPLK